MGRVAKRDGAAPGSAGRSSRGDAGVDGASEAVRLALTALGALQGDGSPLFQRLKWSIGET